MDPKLISLAIVLACVSFGNAVFQAGVSKVDATLPVGAPLAGYNYAPRSSPVYPFPYPQEYTTFMSPSVGALNPTWAKAVVVDNGIDRFAFLTIDAIGADGNLAKMTHDIAKSKGFSVPWEKFTFSGSHTHSGPGAISPSFLWSIAPATDLYVPALAEMMANSAAQALVEAENSLQPAVIDIGTGNLTGATHNRRAGISPYVQYDTIDPHLGVIRIDTAAGQPLLTLWNFAIHGICFDSPNMNFSSDVMGSVCDWIEGNIGGVAMFWNGDAGDINPIFSVCCNNPPEFSGGAVIGKKVQEIRAGLSPTDEVFMSSASLNVDFGVTHLNLTLQRLDNCTSGGILDICSLCNSKMFNCDEDIQLPASWMEETPKFSAFHFNVNSKSIGIVTIPGEALTALGSEIRSDMAGYGFDVTLLAGYTNNHMGYFCTPDEYDIGGYESLLTFWGIETSAKIREGCSSVASQVAPGI